MLRSLTRIFIMLLCLMPLGLAGRPAASSAQPVENRAGLVIQFPDGNTQTYCLSFEGDTITGLDLLIKTGLDLKVEVEALGAFICSIGTTGCDYPAQPCKCQSYGPGGVYWTYHHLKDGKWRASVLGAGRYEVHPGDVEGWAWSSGAPPPVYTFSRLCHALATPTPSPEPPPPPTDTPRPTNTPKPIPTNTPRRPSPTTAIQRQQTNTPQPAPQAPQATLTPTSTQIPPASTPTATLTNTATATPTLQSTSTPTFTSTIPTPSLVPTPTTTPQPASREDTARTIGLLIGGGVLGTLAILGAFTLLRRRGSFRGAP